MGTPARCATSATASLIRVPASTCVTTAGTRSSTEGGACSCATCHVYVSDDWSDRTGPAGDFEDPMLDVAEAERRPTSRLSCQLKMSPALDGIVLIVPQP